MAAKTDIVVKPAAGITPEQARDARARAWRFVFDCYEKQKAARPGGPDDAAKEIKNGCDAKASIPEQR